MFTKTQTKVRSGNVVSCCCCFHLSLKSEGRDSQAVICDVMSVRRYGQPVLHGAGGVGVGVENKERARR